MIAIVSAAIGFLIGAYMPLKMLPEAASYICLFFPGTYSVSLLRTFFMGDQITNVFNIMIQNGMSQIDASNVITQINQDFSYNVNFFGHEMNFGFMLLAIAVFMVIFIVLDLLFVQRTTSVFDISIKRKKK